MKIALVSPYDTAHPGGVFEHIAHLRTEFVRHGHDVTVLAPRGRKGGLEVRDGFYGIGRTVPIPANGSTVRVTFDVTLYTAVKALLRQEQFDVIHLHEPLIPVLPYLVLLNSRSVNVATFRVPGLESVVHRLQTVHDLHDVAPRRAHRRLRAGTRLRQPVFHGPYDIVPNGIDVDRFRDVEPFPWARDGIPRILFVGRYNEPRKGFKYLLRAFDPPAVSRRQIGRRGGGKPDRFDGLMERYGVAMSISSGLSRQRSSALLRELRSVLRSLDPGRAASCYWKRWRRADPSLPGTFRAIAAS